MAHDKRITPPPLRMSRHRIRARAQRYVDSFDTPTHELDVSNARDRVVYGWWAGYDAARTDLQRHARKRRK